MKEFTLTGKELQKMLQDAFRAGRANAQMHEAGLEGDETDSYAAYVMINLHNKTFPNEKVTYF